FTANGSKELTTDAYTPTEGSEHSLTQTIKYDNADDNEKVPQENITYDVEVTAYGQTITTPQFFTGIPQIVGKSGRVYVQLPRKADGTAYSDADVHTACQERGFEPPSTDHYGPISPYETVDWFDDMGFPRGGHTGDQGGKALFYAGWQHSSNDVDSEMVAINRQFGVGGRCGDECEDIGLYHAQQHFLTTLVTDETAEEQDWKRYDEGAVGEVEVIQSYSHTHQDGWFINSDNYRNIICLAPKNNS
ncbi:hypothetical protein, partial [Vibrio sp. 10N.286.46.E10]